MTTIAYRAGVLAADRQANQGNLKTKGTKLFKLGKVAVGVSGSYAHGIAFCRWLLTDQKEDCPIGDDTSALVMSLETGACDLWETPGVGIPIEDEFASIGSGSHFAYGAMEMGADAKAAVRVASKWDVHTGHGVQVVKAKGGK